MSNNAVIYVRVSTDEQAEHGYSLQSQIEACQRYADTHHFNVYKIIQDDFTGAKLERPGLANLRDLIHQGSIGSVIVYSPDRLTRKLAHSLILREEWRQAEVELHFCNRGKVGDSAEDRMTQNIEAVFADYWREKIIESSRRGRLMKAASGKWPCDGSAAYGYRKEGHAHEAVMVIDEYESAMVNYIFELYAGWNGYDQHSFQQIAERLTAEQIPPPNRGAGYKKKGKGWYRTTVWKIMQRESYIGKFRYGGYDLYLPKLAIVDEELFEAAQNKRKRAKNYGTRIKRKYDYVLTGFLKCSCGVSMHGISMARGKHLYYVCSSVGNKRHLRECKEPRYRLDLLEPIVWNWVHDLLVHEDNLERSLHALNESRELGLTSKMGRLTTIKKLRDEHEARIGRLAKAFANESDRMIGEALRKEMKVAKMGYDELQNEYNELANQIDQEALTEKDIKTIMALAQEIRQRLIEPTYEAKRRLYALLELEAELMDNERGEKCLRIQCNLSPTQIQTSLQRKKSKSSTKQTKKPTSKVCGRFSSTMTTSQRSSL